MYKPLRMIAFCVALSCAATFASAIDSTGPDRQEVLPLALRGVYFVPNQGQWADAGVHFGLRSRGLDVAFRESAFTMHLVRQAGSESRNRIDELSPSLDPMLPHSGDSPGDRTDFEHLTLTVSFPGSNSVVPEGGEMQKAKFNYFVGGEGRGVASDVPSFGAVVYHNLYDGVDLHVMGSDDGVLKYEFQVEPGADYGQIRIAYDGIESLCIDDAGDLHIKTTFGTVHDGAPLVWQDSTPASPSGREAGEESRLHIPASFITLDDHTYTFTLLTDTDPSLALIIDPKIEWMSYFGGSRGDQGLGIAVDGAGNALATGSTDSTDFFGRNNSYYGGLPDAFALKVSPSGELLWMTFLGGSSSEYGYGIAVDDVDNALVTGYTQSTDFAGRNNSHHGGFFEGFAVKVSPSGELLWMTYLGGEGGDYAWSIAVDGAGNALVAGETYSRNFAGRNNSYYGGSRDAFVLKVSPSGELQWMTYLGGRDDDVGRGIAVDSAGNALASGTTGSTDFFGRNNASYSGPTFNDAFALKVSPSGQVLWMTYLGGSGSDYYEEGSIAVDSAGSALVTGSTDSSDFAGRNNSYNGGRWDAFALKVNSSGDLQWMTYLGGSGDDRGHGIAEDDVGSALVTGRTQSTDFAGQNNSYHGRGDAFALKISPSGDLQWMTFLGGSDSDWGFGIALDDAANALVTGRTYSTDFAGRNNAHYGGSFDAFIVKLHLIPRLSVETSCPGAGPIHISWECATPSGRVSIFFAREAGSVTIPFGSRCAGTELGLGRHQIQVVVKPWSNESGAGYVDGIAGSIACGGYMQLLDHTTCTTSNVARVE